MLTTSPLLVLGFFHWIFLSCSAVSLPQNHLEHALDHRAGSWNQSLQVGQVKPSEASRIPTATISNAEPLSTGHSGRRLPNTFTTNATTTGYFPKYDEICALWDSSCMGDEQSAFSVLNENIMWEEGHFCDLKSLDADFSSRGETLQYQRVRYSTCTPCLADAPETSKSAVSQVMEFARSPKCTSMLSERICRGNLKTDSPWCTFRPTEDTVCANRQCYFNRAEIELLYWPVEGSDTSCLSIIGDGNGNGAITRAHGYADWGCTTLSTAQNGSIFSQYFTTATQYRANKHFTYKQELFNPWDTTVPCLGLSDHSTGSQTSSVDLSALRVRAHAFVNSTQITAKENHTSVRIAVSDGFTL